MQGNARIFKCFSPAKGGREAGSPEIFRNCRLFLACPGKGEYNVYNYENMGYLCKTAKR